VHYKLVDTRNTHSKFRGICVRLVCVHLFLYCPSFVKTGKISVAKSDS
jgi:hypothetical protein